MSRLRTTAEIRIGCSGWQYRHWRGSFYPADLAQKRWLAYYATHFDTVEINNTFYRLPEASAIVVWKRSVPKKLKDPEEPLERLYSRVRVLGHHLGPVLYQLPPHWSVDVERLTGFLATLPARQRHVIEFRDPSWYTDEVFDLLARHGVVCCTHDMPGSVPERRTVGPFVYQLLRWGELVCSAPPAGSVSVVNSRKPNRCRSASRRVQCCRVR